MVLMPTPLATGAERRGQRRVHGAPRVLVGGRCDRNGGLAAARPPEALEPLDVFCGEDRRERLQAEVRLDRTALEPDPRPGEALLQREAEVQAVAAVRERHGHGSGFDTVSQNLVLCGGVEGPERV